MATIAIQSLRKEYEISDGVEIAVEDIDFEVKEEEFLTIVGPSGCGKTTTLRCIAGLETPTTGSIELNGVGITNVPPNDRDLAMMFQSIALYPHMTVRENIEYPLKVRRVDKETRKERATEAATTMQIRDMLDKYPGDLSGGQRQRAALARTIVQDPDGFLMDEPLSDLDAKLKVEIRKEIQEIQKKVKKPTVYVTHDQEEAMTMSDRIAVMNNGKIEQIGTPDELYNSPVNVFVSQFIGNPSMNFLKGNIKDRSGNSLTVEVNDKEFSFNINIDDNYSNPNILLGIRPEDLIIEPQNNNNDDSNKFQGKVRLIERLGKEKSATIDGPQGELQAIIPADTADTHITEDELISISFDADDIYIFDRDTGERISHRKD